MAITGRLNKLVLSAASLFVIFAIVRAADAATITVNSLNDPGASGICVLRDAITAANTEAAVNGCTAGSGNDTIVFSVTGTITLSATLPPVTNTLAIQGPSASPPAITIDGELHVVVSVNSGATLNLNSLAVTDGFSALSTGTINNNGTLRMTNSAFDKNFNPIFSEGLLSVSNSTFSDNGNNVGGAAAIVSTSPQTVTVTNSTFEDNQSPTEDGAINADSLTVTNSTFTGNKAFFGGGAIGANTLTVTNSTFTDNSAFCPAINCTPGAEGGAIAAGSLTVSNSTFVDNSAELGGAISAGSEFGSVTITNSTFVGNSAIETATLFSSNRSGLGGAIFDESSTSVTNSTFSANSAAVDGGAGIFTSGGTLAVTNTTFNGNVGGAIANGIFIEGLVGTADVKGTILTDSTGSNCVGSITDEGYNLDDDGSCGFASGPTSDSAIALDPAGLQNNGGPTETIALEAGSVAINQIPVADCTDQSSPPVRLLTDQRGVLRPQFTACDIGAYEYDTARSLKTNVLDALPSLTGGNRADQQALKVASANLALAVRYYWSGNSGNVLNPVLGRLDFLAEGRALNALAGALIPSSLLPPATIENYILNILIADRTLAVTAIAAAGGDSDATALVTQGDTQTAADQYSQALKSYQQAWSLAVSYVR